MQYMPVMSGRLCDSSEVLCTSCAMVSESKTKQLDVIIAFVRHHVQTSKNSTLFGPPCIMCVYVY